MNIEHEVYKASRLLHWALQPEITPRSNEEYAELIRRYVGDLEFRQTVVTIAGGLGLEIIGGPREDYSLILAPTRESPFWMRPSDYRPNSKYSADNRLLDGLIQVAIVATVYPRNTDLLNDTNLTRNAVTVEEIETTLRQIVERLEEEARDQPDPTTEGLYEAWRIYKNRPAVQKTKDNRSAVSTTHRMIEYALEYLCKQRCFKRDGQTFQPLLRYQVLVQDYAATRIYKTVRDMLEKEEV
jgi:hypothetical protein